MEFAHDLASRWQAAPLYVRQAILEELDAVKKLLNNDVDFNEWQQAHSTPSMAMNFAAEMEKLNAHILQVLDHRIDQVLATTKTELKLWLRQHLSQVLQNIGVPDEPNFDGFDVQNQKDQ